MKLGFLGLDVSKGYSDFTAIGEDKLPLCDGFKLMDNRNGHTKLLEKITWLQQTHQLDAVYCGMESTGGYENNWFRTLNRNGDESLKVCRINPISTHHESKVQLNRIVDDKIASHTIAIHLANNHERLFNRQQLDEVMGSGRKLYQLIKTVKKQKIQLTNQLEKIVYNAVPELLTLSRGRTSKWIWNLLAKYPSLERIKKAKTSSLAKIKGISESKAEKIKKAVDQSVGYSGDVVLEYTIKSLVTRIIDLEKQVTAHKKFLCDIGTSPSSELLESINGIGAYTAIGLVMEIENPHRFETASKISSYFGVHPAFKASGTYQSKTAMSKKGRASCRDLLYMGAVNVARCNPHFRRIYLKKRKQGMCYNQAIGVVMHKLLRVVYGMLKSNKPFDEGHEKRETEERSQDTQQLSEEKINELNKELNEMSEAPCSRRKVKKIQADLVSQSSTMDERTRSKNPPG